MIRSRVRSIYLDIEIIDKRYFFLAARFALFWILLEMDSSSRISAQADDQSSDMIQRTGNEP